MYAIHLIVLVLNNVGEKTHASDDDRVPPCSDKHESDDSARDDCRSAYQKPASDSLHIQASSYLMKFKMHSRSWSSQTPSMIS